MFVESFMESKNLNDEVTYVKMLCMNASDPEVGRIVQKHHDAMMRKPIIHQIKNKFKPINFDLLGAILIGVSITRKTLKNPSLTKLNNQEYENILRYLNDKKTKHDVADLQKNIWDYSTDMETHTVETHIYRLRKKISDLFKDEKFILSHKNGYFID